jgi:hypothetical protein
MPTKEEKLNDWIRKNGYGYWCFLSWAHGSPEERRFAEKLRKDLIDELSTYFDAPQVFLDTSEIRTGHIWKRRISEALCRSVMLVAICTPTYFSRSHRYCGLEWTGMLRLGRRRLKDNSETCVYSLIYRKPEEMPGVFREVQFRDISDGALSRRYRTTGDYQKVRDEILDRVRELAKKLKRRGASADCAKYRLPGSSAFDDWRPGRPVLPTRRRP